MSSWLLLTQMTIRKIPPSPPLREYVRHYLYRDVSIPRDVVVRPLHARADPFLAFHLDDPCEVFEYHTGRARLLPPAYVVRPPDAAPC